MRSVHPRKEELVLCFTEMNEEDEAEHESEGWTNLTDRGGLQHVNDVTYMLFVSMELALRQHLTSTCASEMPRIVEKVEEKINSGEYVLFYWSIISVNWDEEEAKELLEMMIEQWVSVRGFSFAQCIYGEV